MLAFARRSSYPLAKHQTSRSPRPPKKDINMKRNSKSLNVFAVLFILAGVVILARTYTTTLYAAHQHLDTFTHTYWPKTSNLHYRQLFEEAATLQQRVGAMHVAFHGMTGFVALFFGLLLLAVANDTYIDTTGRRPKPDAAGDTV